MKICLITKECFPFYYGGIGSTFYALGKILSGLGHKVILLSKKPANKELTDISSYYNNDFSINWVEYTEGQFFTHSALDYSFQLEKHFEKFNKTFKADLVIIPEFDGEGFFLMKENTENDKYPTVHFAVHFSGPLFSLYESAGKEPGLFEQVIFKMEEYSIRSSACSIAPSEFIWNYLNKRFDLKTQKNFIYPNPVNPSVFTQPRNDERKTSKNIVFVGRLQDVKGADWVIEAFEKIYQANPDVKLQMIGADLYWDKYQATFTDYWKNRLSSGVLSKIEFPGALSQQQLLDYLTEASVAVFPSRFETFGNVALESMYLGVPVIVNNNVGLADAIGKNYGFYWRDDEGVEALAKKLEQVITDTGLQDQLRKRSFERASELHNNKEKTLASLIEKLLKTTSERLQDLRSVTDALFILSNQYGAYLVQEKNSESQEQIKKAWAEYDKKNQEMERVYKKHDEELKEAWSKYDEKDRQLADTWKKHDEKEVQLSEVWKKHNEKDTQLSEARKKHDEKEKIINERIEEYRQMKEMYDRLNEEIRRLEQSIQNIPGLPNGTSQTGNIIVAREQWPEITSIHNIFLLQQADSKSLKQRIELLWDDLKKEQYESGMLKKNITAMQQLLDSREAEMGLAKEQAEALDRSLQNTRRQLSALENSEAYTTALKLQQRKFLWKLVKKITG